jgi:hypothetical protein
MPRAADIFGDQNLFQTRWLVGFGVRRSLRLASSSLRDPGGPWRLTSVSDCSPCPAANYGDGECPSCDCESWTQGRIEVWWRPWKIVETIGSLAHAEWCPFAIVCGLATGHDKRVVGTYRNDGTRPRGRNLNDFRNERFVKSSGANFVFFFREAVKLGKFLTKIRILSHLYIIIIL